MQMRRKIYAMILAAVIMPTIFLASYHHHEAADNGSDCVECAHHHPHSHISGVRGTDDCLICQFLTITWLPASGLTALDPGSIEIKQDCDLLQSAESVSIQAFTTRGPPQVFC